jgi:predicted Zn finger-like uncharacterized protein
MILACPSCAARFKIDPETVGQDGRLVRCGRCGHEWLAVKPIEGSNDSAAPSAAEPTLDAKPEPAADSPLEPVPELPPAPILPALPRRRRDGGAWISVLGWGTLALVVGALSIGVFARERVLALWPGAVQIYAALGFVAAPPPPALKLVDLNRSWVTRDGATILVVEGRIVNEGDLARPIPQLRGILRDGENREIQAWTFGAERDQIAPGQSIAFRTEVKEPAPAAAGLSVTFVAGN